MPNEISANWSAFSKLASTVIPKDCAKHLGAKYKHWESYKGRTWVVNRLKALNDIAKLLLSGRNSEAIEVGHANSIKLDKSGIPAGVEGLIITTLLKTKRGPVLRRCFALLRAYSGLKLKVASPGQLAKARSNISNPPTYKEPKKVSIPEWGAKYGGVIPEFWHCIKPLVLGSIKDLSGTSSYPHSLGNVGKKPFERMVASFASRGGVPDSLTNYFEQEPLMLLAASRFSDKIGNDAKGNIVILQEGGAKARVICSPNAWVQYYMYPLHRFLSGIIKKEEQREGAFYGLSCVTDQLKGAYHTRSVLDSGGFVASVDLSAATDRFPLYIQTSLLTHLGLEAYASALYDLRGDYDFPDGSKISYNTGQPMGLYGSFPLFHLTHMFVLRYLSESLGLEKDAIHFCVLGDDVVFFDEELHELYRQTMSNLGVSISEHKSYNGNVVEFAGFLVIKTGDTTHAFRPYKWGDGLEYSSIVNTLYAFGSKVAPWGHWWSKAYSTFVRTIGWRSIDLAPLVPSGGNIEGVNQVVSEEYLMGIYNVLGHSHPELPDTLSIPSIFDVGWESWSHGRQTSRDLRYPSFDPRAYAREDLLRKKKDVLRLGFMSDPLVREETKAQGKISSDPTDVDTC